MSKGTTLLLLMTIVLGYFTYRSSYAFFSDSASATGNTFTAASVFPTATPTPVPNLVINEVASDGNSTLEWVEIYNPTASPVDVTGWKIEDGNTEDVFPSISPIPSNGYAVIKGNTSTAAVPVTAVSITLGNATIGSGLNDSGDLVRLKTPTDVVVDAMSFGNNTTIFATPPSAPSGANTLRRIPNGTDTDSAVDWQLGSSSIGNAN